MKKTVSNFDKLYNNTKIDQLQKNLINEINLIIKSL